MIPGISCWASACFLPPRQVARSTRSPEGWRPAWRNRSRFRTLSGQSVLGCYMLPEYRTLPPSLLKSLGSWTRVRVPLGAGLQGLARISELRMLQLLGPAHPVSRICEALRLTLLPVVSPAQPAVSCRRAPVRWRTAKVGPLLCVPVRYGCYWLPIAFSNVRCRTKQKASPSGRKTGRKERQRPDEEEARKA